MASVGKDLKELFNNSDNDKQVQEQQYSAEHIVSIKQQANEQAEFEENLELETPNADRETKPVTSQP